MKQNLWDQSFFCDVASLCEVIGELSEARLSWYNYLDFRSQEIFLFYTRNNTSLNRELEQQIVDRQEHKYQNLKC